MNIVKLIAAVVVLALSPVVFGQDLKLGESFVGDLPSTQCRPQTVLITT